MLTAALAAATILGLWNLFATADQLKTEWQRRHHIIDPRTNLPAETGVLTSTVTAPTSIQAEWAAKTSLPLGSEGGLEWLNVNPELAGMLVLEDGQCLYSGNNVPIHLHRLR